MGKLSTIRLVLASPSDVGAERLAVQQVVDELNTGIARPLGTRFELSRWETDAYPGFHLQGPQAHIESLLKIEDCDLLVCVFGRRFGTPTSSAGSGTESEFRRAYKAWKAGGSPQIMMYFRREQFTPTTADEATQWNALIDFRLTFPTEGLYSEYDDTDDFREMFRRHLSLFLGNLGLPITYRVPLHSLSNQKTEHSAKVFDTSTGEYRILTSRALRRPGSDLRLPLLEFDFEVTARKVSGSDGSWYGVYIAERRARIVKYHDFFVSGKGTYTYEVKVMEVDETTQRDLQIREKARLGVPIRLGNSENRLRLARHGSRVEFWVNGESLLDVNTSLARTQEVQVGIAVHAERNLLPGDQIEVAFSDWIFHESHFL